MTPIGQMSRSNKLICTIAPQRGEEVSSLERLNLTGWTHRQQTQQKAGIK